MSTDATHLPDDLATCHALIGQLAATNDQFSATVETQQRRLEQLEHYVAQLLRARYGPRSEKVDPAQLALFDPNAAEPAAESWPQPEPLDTVVRAHRRRGKRQPLPAELPRERVEHDLTEEEKCCPACGQQRERIGCQTSEQLEFVPASLYVVEHVRWKYACRGCQEHVAIARPAAKPIERGIPGPGLLAQLIVSKYGDHLPLYRLEDVFARHGVELARSTLCRWARLAADRLAPLYQLMVAEVRRSQVIHTDDTPVPVLDAELPHTRTGRFWVYVGDTTHPYSVYDYTPSRKRDGPAEFLAGYSGYLAADAFSGYDGIYVSGTVKQVLCWAHARRKFYEARTAQPAAHQALAFIRRLYDIEREANGCSVERRLKLLPCAEPADFGSAARVARDDRAHSAAQEPAGPGDRLRVAALGWFHTLLRGWAAGDRQQPLGADTTAVCDWTQELVVPGQRPRRAHGGHLVQPGGQRQATRTGAIRLSARRVLPPQPELCRSSARTVARRLAAPTPRRPALLAPLTAADDRMRFVARLPPDYVGRVVKEAMRTRALGRARPGEWVSRARPSFTSTSRLLVQYLGSTSPRPDGRQTIVGHDTPPLVQRSWKAVSG